jgi:uncharacterized protein (DUF1697 family)
MKYLALLRGINVGGERLVSMKELKAVFEDAGMLSVRTYINSGNVIFSSGLRGQKRLAKLLEQAIEERFGFDVTVVLRTVDDVRRLVKAIPSGWKDDKTTRCYVMFLAPEADKPSIVKEMEHRPEIEDLRYTSGAVVWRIDRKDVPKSRVLKLMRTPLYKQMTIRNSNTARKLLELMHDERSRIS